MCRQTERAYVQADCACFKRSSEDKNLCCRIQQRSNALLESKSPQLPPEEAATYVKNGHSFSRGEDSFSRGEERWRDQCQLATTATITAWMYVHVNALPCSSLSNSIPAALTHCQRERAELPQSSAGPMSTRRFWPDTSTLRLSHVQDTAPTAAGPMLMYTCRHPTHTCIAKIVAVLTVEALEVCMEHHMLKAVQRAQQPQQTSPRVSSSSTAESLASWAILS